MSSQSQVVHDSIFPTYLLPSRVFRRRQASRHSTTSTSSASSHDTPGSISLTGSSSYLRCSRCAADLCSTTQIISKGFTGRHGRAYLVSASPTAHGHSMQAPSSSSSSDDDFPSLPNTHDHTPMHRLLVTGGHTVSDISCRLCGNVLGWKYLDAEEDSQKYKVGKYILETKRICAASAWEGLADAPEMLPPKDLDPNAIEFDSQDEDECEELFAGTWNRAVTAKRRQARNMGKNRR